MYLECSDLRTWCSIQTCWWLQSVILHHVHICRFMFFSLLQQSFVKSVNMTDLFLIYMYQICVKTKNLKLNFLPTKYYTKSYLQKSEEVLSTYYGIISSHYRYICSVLIRETIEGWPLLTVETKVNRNSKSTNGGILPWLVRWACLAAPVGQNKIYFFLIVHFFNSFVPIAQLAGRSAVLGRLSLSMCLWC